MSALQVGDVLEGRFVTLDPRYYIVTKITPQKIKARRLKIKKDGSRSDQSYGDEITMTKKDKYSATHYNQINTKIGELDSTLVSQFGTLSVSQASDVKETQPSPGGSSSSNL